MSGTNDDAPSLYFCGCKPDDHDPSERCTGDTCTCGGALELGYGLAAGSIGTYYYCTQCGRYWNFTEDGEI